MKIAILNLSKDDELKYTLNCLESISDEMIAVKIDLFINKNQEHLVQDKIYINQVIALEMDNLNIFNFFRKLDSLKFYTRNKYNIAIDTQGTLKSAYLTYNLTGKTAGLKYNGFKGFIISKFYDEYIPIDSNTQKEEKIKELLSITFGF